MFLNTEKYTEYDKHIKNGNRLCKMHQQIQSTFENPKNKVFEKYQNTSIFVSVYIYKKNIVHNMKR